MKIAGVVVLYHPEKENIIESINSYLDYIDVLYAIDNTEKSNEKHREVINNLKEIDKIEYIPNNKNLGIAKALNMGAKRAIEQGYKWLLTMDQDSKFKEGSFDKMLEFIKNNSENKIGIISPFHLTISNLSLNFKNEYEEVLTAMTSGNLLNLKAYQEVGPFLEDLFIDYVDVEYCLRLNKYGYKVIVVNSSILIHKLGNIREIRIPLWKTLYPTNHNPLRRYYITRNRFYVMELYKNEFPDFCKRDKIAFFKELATILLLENSKLTKLKYIIKGYMDFRQKKMGKIDE
ncbi:glycosyl transferase family protein [Methanocaldococcus bathoardescens]|uniref:Glycosyl transferase family protein n=1 Tax=Methanocaldococcus bathoardescens TaxID=1301915 RepID=A0A076LER2_9EURY|nr:glycosyltransferase family 2 protein [Methanocaldococcus bathoardescens]AIJ04918.1 glycosyl transferase family protein [Methanocaldococcus bathoardescens]